MGLDDRIADLSTIFVLAERVLGDKETADRWMRTPIPSLNNDTPHEHIMKDGPNAFENVKDVLHKIEHGIY